jgi:hypothetical protein
MPKKKPAPSWTDEDIRKAHKIMEDARRLSKQKKREASYDNRELALSETRPHKLHMEVCQKNFGIAYMDESMRSVRSYISHFAAKAKERKRSEAFFSSLKEGLSERIKELRRSGGLHPEDELHLVASHD